MSAHRKTGYSAQCTYDGITVGRCTQSDSEAYVALMESCDGDAARVMREYAYFSPELKAILEKVAEIQAKSVGIFHEPKTSPWGVVQTCDILCPGVFLVSTDSHGGTMVTMDMIAALSPAAKKCGVEDGSFLCFEEDCQENVVLRELLDKKLWTIPERIKDKAAFEENINKSLREYNPEYWRTRQVGIENMQSRKQSSLAHATER